MLASLRCQQAALNALVEQEEQRAAASNWGSSVAGTEAYWTPRRAADSRAALAGPPGFER